MLAELARWWTQQMLDLLPRRPRTRQGERGAALVIDCPDARLPVTVTVWRRRRRAQTLVGRLTFGMEPSGALSLHRGEAHAAVLRVPVAPLECEVALPLAAEAEMARLLQAELDRLTPFPAEAVFWSATIRHRDAARGRLHAALSMVPKAALAPLLAALQERGVSPGILEASRPDGTVCRIALRPPVRQRQLVPMLAAGAAVVMVAALLVAPFLLQARAAAALDRRVAELQPQVDRVQALRRRVVSRSVDDAVVDVERHRVGDAMQVLATLTNLLGDDTFLSSLTLRQRRLAISGQSAAAAGLIATLSGDSLITDPAFAAAVVRDPATQTDTFSVNAVVAP